MSSRPAGRSATGIQPPFVSGGSSSSGAAPRPVAPRSPFLRRPRALVSFLTKRRNVAALSACWVLPARWLGLVAILALSAAPAHAAAPDDSSVLTLTLPQALDYARSHQVSLAVTKARIATAAADAAVPGASWKPTVALTGQAFAYTANNTTATYVGSPWLDIPRVGGTKATAFGSLAPEPSTLAGVGVRQLLFDAGLTAAQQAAADAVTAAEKQGAEAAWLDVALGVEEAWFAVHAARQVLKAADAAVARSKAHRDLAKAGVDRKLRPMIDLTREEAQLQRAEVDQLRAGMGLQMAQSVLAAAIGAPGPGVDVAGSANPDTSLPSLQVALDHAVRHAPQLLAQAARVAAQHAETAAIAARSRPVLYATGGATLRAGGAAPSSGPEPALGGWLPAVPNWFAGLVLNWPLYDAGNAARVEASQAREAGLDAQTALLQEQQRVAVRQAYLTVQQNVVAIGALERALDAAQANFTQADARFQAGLGTGIDVTDAATRLSEAEIQAAIGRFQAARARAVLARIMAEALHGND
jgi:outer membrane protein